MSSSNNRLDLLIRKNKGKSLLNKYKEIFFLSGFKEDELIYIDLDKSDKLLSYIRTVFPMIQQSVEILSENSTYHDSKLLTSIFVNLDSSDGCYIFSDDVYYCGMYLTDAKSVQEHCLNVARLGYSNTCFLLDKELKFSFTINFYNEGSIESKNKFDIQLKLIT
ncbi:hypothetical protein HDF25_002134 [Pedobacter cryoconitis]|uniref:Uncharacterized protein n=1 Tax=Pedobacter cryoconitis TaxID=188932 RepID=A0A7X0J2R3_9SPHI|nr:hypothetical protein [Pedobacter cryoconitis]